MHVLIRVGLWINIRLSVDYLSTCWALVIIITGYLEGLVLVQDDDGRRLKSEAGNVHSSMDRAQHWPCHVTSSTFLQAQLDMSVINQWDDAHLPNSRLIDRRVRHDVIVSAELDQWQSNIRTYWPITDAGHVHCDVIGGLHANSCSSSNSMSTKLTSDDGMSGGNNRRGK